MNRKRRAVWLLLAVGTAVLDLWSKSLCRYPQRPGYPHDYLQSTDRWIIDDWFRIHAVWNEGGVWSLPLSESVLLVATMLAVPALILWLFWPRRASRWEHAAKALVLGGAVGNLWDRIEYGAVRDFIDVYLFGWSYPVFNVADIALVAGIAILLVLSFREAREKKKEPAREAA